MSVVGSDGTIPGSKEYFALGQKSLDNTSFEHSYYILENTGWSNKTSWFAESNNKRYATYEEAEARYEQIKAGRPSFDPSILWRITKVISKYKYTALNY